MEPGSAFRKWSTIALLVAMLVAVPLFTVNQRQGGASASGQFTPECWPTDRITVTGGSLREAVAVQRTSFYEIHDDDSVNPNHLLSGLPHFDTLTWEGSADVEWLVLEGDFDHYVIDVGAHKVTFYDVQGSIHVVYRTQNFVQRLPDQIRFCVNGTNSQAWATQIKVLYPSKYQILAAQPNNYTNPVSGELRWDLGVVNTFQIDTTFGGLGPDRPQLDLPVDYEDRTEGWSLNFAAAFRTRITSKFDHRYPNYAKDEKFLAANGMELDDFSRVPCTYGYNCYDGHNAYDIDDRCPAATSPCENASAVFAAADGTIVASSTGWNDQSGCRITIDHGSGWKTFYGHLADSKKDESCDGILVWSGEVSRTTQIGKIGGSGAGGGGDNNTHLHFGVYHNGVVVDPSGWEPNTAQNPDPWAENPSGGDSYPMWLYSTRTTQSLDPASGGQLTSPTHEVVVDVPAQYYPTALIFNLSYESVADGGGLVSTGHSFSLTASNSSGAFVNQLVRDIAISVQFEPGDVQYVRPDSLRFYRYDDEMNRWLGIPTQVNWDEGVATAMTNHLSIFAFSGAGAIAPIFIPVTITNP